ncbi:MAG: TatD family hydrolase [Thermoguttaceae bacterium]|jgi:TatD DNase family protein
MPTTGTSARGFTDVHVHLQDPRFGKTFDEIGEYLQRAKSHGISRFICASASPADWNRTAALARRFSDVLPTFGIHPWNCQRVSDGWVAPLTLFLDECVAKDGVFKAAIGEAGLDYAVRDCDDSVRAAQEKTLRLQLELADERKLPATLHSVRSNDALLTIMKDYPNVPVWLLHGWRLTENDIERAVDMGAFFSFSDRSLSNEVSRQGVARVPRDRILLESDGPRLLPPNGYGNKRGEPIRKMAAVQALGEGGYILAEPAALLRTATEIAELRRVAMDEFFRQLAVNEKRFLANWPRVSVDA